MESTEVRYEVHVNDGGRWTVYTDASTRGRAIQEAQTLLGSGKFDAAKVTEERGQSREILIWHEQVQRVQKAETISPVDDAPVCTTLDDFYKIEARLTVGRLLRQILDGRSATPLELLHDYGLIREITRKDELYLQALQNVGGVLARKSKQKPLEAIEFLEEMVGKIAKRAESLPDLDRYLATLDGGIGAALTAIERGIGATDSDFLLRATLARRLRKSRDWEGKLVLMLDLADKSTGQAGFALIDEAIAEILDGPEAMQEILGYRRNLAAALEVMLRVVSGAFTDGDTAATPLGRVSAKMGQGLLPLARESLTERVVRSLGGIAPLTKGDRSEQQDAFRGLAQQLISSTMFANSGPLCVAATLRAKSVMKDEYADESSEKAINDMILLLPTFASKLGYLLDLLGTDFGVKCQNHIIACMADVLASITSVAQIAETGATNDQIVRAAAGIRDRLLATSLPQEWRQRFAKRIYDLLITYATPGAPAVPSVQSVPVAAKQAAPAQPAAKATEGPRTFTAGDVIFSEGEAGDVAYLIVSGTVDILKRAGDRDIVIGQVGPGNIIGEMALIDSQPRMATARTAEETTVNVIPREAIKARLDKLEKFDPVLRRLMGMFVDRMRDFRYMSADS